MKFKFLTLTLLVLTLNCQAAEENPKIYSEIEKLSKSIAILRNNITKTEEALKESEHWTPNLRDKRQADFKQDICSYKAKLAQKTEERKALISQLEQGHE